MLLTQIVGIALLIPFFGWAIFLLRRRFQYFEENSLALEALTVLALFGFFWVEATVLKYALANQMLLYIFAILGLSVSAFALYAHVLISLASRILVDLVTPGDATAVDQPRFGPVDSLERNEDYEGALQEYLVLARIYPRNFEVLSRTGRVQEILGQPEEAVTWYLRARKRAVRADDALAAVNHLCTLYDNQLDQPDQAEQQLAEFLRDFPDSPDYPIVLDRLERRANAAGFSVSSFLESLSDSPLAEGAEDGAMLAVGAPVRARRIELVTLDSAGVLESTNVAPALTGAPGERPAPKNIALDRLESAAPPPLAGSSTGLKVVEGAKRVETEPPRTRPTGAGLEALESLEPAVLPKSDADAPPATKPKITLESMDS